MTSWGFQVERPRLEKPSAYLLKLGNEFGFAAEKYAVNRECVGINIKWTRHDAFGICCYPSIIRKYAFSTFSYFCANKCTHL